MRPWSWFHTFRKHHNTLGLAPRASEDSIRNSALWEDRSRGKPESVMVRGGRA
jgi:hypothetical protein